MTVKCGNCRGTHYNAKGVKYCYSSGRLHRPNLHTVKGKQIEAKRLMDEAIILNRKAYQLFLDAARQEMRVNR